MLENNHDMLKLLVKKQLNNLFFLNDLEKQTLDIPIETALKKSINNFSHQNNKYFWAENKVVFNPYHSGQYAIFLYYLSNVLMEVDRSLADRVYYLNKILNGVDLYYEIKLPDIFFLEHPVGSVMGRAVYSNYFSFLQNCTVGNNKGYYPIFEENVTLLSGAKVIGKCRIGENSVISANCYVKDTDIPKNSIVFGSSPNLIIKNKGNLNIDNDYWIY